MCVCMWEGGVNVYGVVLCCRAAHPSSSGELLVEVEAVTSVVARASSRQAEAELSGSAPALRRLRSLMLVLLARFARPTVHDELPLIYYKVCYFAMDLAY